MERGLRDHSKHFLYERLRLWEMKAYFYFLFSFPLQLTCYLTWQLQGPEPRLRSTSTYCWILQLNLERAPGESLCMFIRTKWCKLFGVRRWELTGLVVVLIRGLFFPWDGEWVWITVIKCFRVVSQSVVALSLHMKIDIIVVSMFLQFLRSLGMHLSSPALFSSLLFSSEA